MVSRPVIFALLALWALAWGWSVLGLWVIEPTGDGFTRGLNRTTAFLGWQAVAAALAIVLFLLRKRVPGRLSWALWVPLGLLLAVVLFIVGLLVWAQIDRMIWSSQAPAPPAPVTAPAEPLP